MSETTSHDVPSVSSSGTEPASPVKTKSAFEPTASDIIPAKPNFNKDLKADKPSSVSDRGYDVRRYPSSITEERLDIVRADCGWDTHPVWVFAPGPDESVTDHRFPKGLVAPRSESTTEPTASASEFDTAGASRALAAATAAKRKRPSDQGQQSKKRRARSVTRTLRDETEPDIIVRRVDAEPSVAPIPEGSVAVAPLRSTGEGLLVPALHTVLANEAFVHGQQEMGYLRGQMDAQGHETEKYQHLLREKEEELSRAVALSNLRPELDAARAENSQLKSELASMTEYNRSLEADKLSLTRDNAQISSRLGELETTFSQLRGELDLVKSDAASLAERNRVFKSESARYKELARVFEEKAEMRARMYDDLKNEPKETADANDALKTELESAVQMQNVFREARDALEARLAQAEAELDEALRSVGAAEAQITMVAQDLTTMSSI
ncbi:uncharacterized protein LOC132611816 [Lycium barbarum]|uniref:uncharacterized protein LOC132611816 n=1 Tax=Lycium barbarum TaxID=112863 RepID=UPI00293F5996|nr:uncharacterized protein LOC132611816 [Lycium barbarum]